MRGFCLPTFFFGRQKKGVKCPESGKLIDHVARIAKFHKPKFILLENVPNVLTIEDGKFWKYIQTSFDAIGYQLIHKVISPVDLGIPQNRKRVFIIGLRKDIDIESYQWPDFIDLKRLNFPQLLDKQLEHKQLESQKKDLLILWQELLQQLKLPNLHCTSIVAPEFGATYPENFSQLSLKQIKHFKGAYGVSLEACSSMEEVYKLMPR